MAATKKVLPPPDPRFVDWPTERKYEYAARLVVWEGWSHRVAANEVGISRPRLSEFIRGNRVRLEAERTPDSLPRISHERRRVPDRETFERLYFAHMVCPDCGVHHPDPEFHTKIRAALRDPSIKRGLILLPPYHSKSTEVSVKDTIYDIVFDPNSRTILVSKSETFVKTFLVSVKEWLTNDGLYTNAAANLIEDWGPFKGSDMWSTTGIMVAGRVSAEKDPTVQVLGVGQQIYGRRADKIKFDDIATLENQASPQRVASMLEWIDKEALSRIGRNGSVWWAGTRVSPGDIYPHLEARDSYTVLKWPCILDEEKGLTLWPDHFPYSAAVARRAEMSEGDWQLIYQQLSTPGVNAAFTQEDLDLGKDRTRRTGEYEEGWVLVAGLDLAGGTQTSGFTAAVLKAVDPETGRRYYVDSWNIKSMRPAQLKEAMLAWTDAYPIVEWRVEKNGMQSQLVQYNDEIIRHLAERGVRVVPHQTGSNKWDPEFGVESMAPMWAAAQVSVPWGDSASRQQWQPLLAQLLMFPLSATSDLAMADWMADLGLRERINRRVMPMFSNRRVPEHVARRRVVVDWQTGRVQRVGLDDQRRAMLSRTFGGKRPRWSPFRELLEPVSVVPPDYEGPDPEVL